MADPGFLSWRHQPKGWCAKLLFLPFFSKTCMKLKIGQRGCVPSAPLDPPMVSWSDFEGNHCRGCSRKTYVADINCLFIFRLEQILSTTSDPYEKAYKLLNQWKNQSALEATQQALIDLLRDAASTGMISAQVADVISGPTTTVLPLIGTLL